MVLPTVPATILEQLGGKRIFKMAFAGATYAPDAVTLKIAPGLRAKDGITHVVIKLTPADEYALEFWKIRGTKTTRVSAASAWCDNLREVVEKTTGLYLSL